MRTIIAFLVAPIMPVIMVAVLDPHAALVIALFGYLTVVMLGFPAHLLLLKLAWLGWVIYTLAGFVIGMVGGIIVGIILAASNHKPPNASMLVYVFDAAMVPFEEPMPFLFLGFLGAIGSLTFWLIARPDVHLPRPTM